MKLMGARALQSKAVVYIVDTCAAGSLERSALAIMNRVAREGVLTFLVAPLSVEEAAGMELLCHEVFSIPELAARAGAAQRRSWWSRAVGFLKMCRVLSDLTAEFGEVVVHTHGFRAGFWGRWAAWLVGAGHTVHTVYSFSFGPFMKAYQWWFWYVAEYLTSWVTSEYICFTAKDKALGNRFLPFFFKRCVLAALPVDWVNFYTPEAPPARRLPVSPIVVAMVLEGGVTQRETLSCFLRMIEHLHSLGVPIRGEVIGDVVGRWEATQWLLERGLHQQVHFLGWGAQNATVMKGWHVFVSCSLSDVPTPAVVQARLSWVPVVAYATAGVSEVLKNDTGGLLVAPGDSAALFKAVYRLLIDRPLYERLSLNQDNLADHSEAAVVQRHLKLYKNVAGN